MVGEGTEHGIQPSVFMYRTMSASVDALVNFSRQCHCEYSIVQAIPMPGAY